MRVLERPVFVKIDRVRQAAKKATQVISDLSASQVYHSARGYISGLLPLAEIDILRQELQQTKLELQNSIIREAALKKENFELQNENIRLKKELSEAQVRIENLEAEVITDPLSGLLNKRGFDAAMARETKLFKRHGHHFSIVAVDIDKFKDINDTFGHEAGDIAIKSISGEIKTAVRESDFVGRCGGDEITVLLPLTDFEKAKSTAEKLRKKVEDLQIPASKALVITNTTVSVGVASSENVNDPDNVKKAADKNAYLAKARGRNQVASRTLSLEEILTDENPKI